MRKCFFDKQLRLACTRATHRRAFSLAELIVSIGVLVLMLALAGQVMSLTVKSTGQARAITEVNQQLRIFERKLREDLRGVQPGESVMLIQGNPINAYWTDLGKQADDDGNPRTGYPHAKDREREDPQNPGNLQSPRADVLMFFTSRKATSNVHPNLEAKQLVVYGHANLGDYTPDGAFTPNLVEAFPPAGDFETVFKVPAERWHLARRGVFLSPRDAHLLPPSESPTTLDDPLLLRGETDVIERFTDGPVVVEGFKYDEYVLTPAGPAPWYLPSIFYDDEVEQPTVPHARSQIDLAPPPTVRHAVNQFFLSNCASFKVEWALDPNSDFVGGRLDSLNEILWFDPGALPPDPPPTDREPYELAELTRAAEAADHDLEMTLKSLLSDGLGGHGIGVYSLEERFGGMDDVWLLDPWLYPDGNDDKRAYTAVFRRQPVPGGDPDESEPDEIFPGALRITVDVYDRERRLERPVRHVIIVPVGG